MGLRRRSPAELTDRLAESPAARTPDPPRPLNSLVASAKRIAGERMKRSRPEKWQDEGWRFYDEVGELRYVANTLASSLSRASIFAAGAPEGDEAPHPVDLDEPDPEDEDATPPTEADRLAVEAINALGGGALGRAEIIRRLAVHLFVAGDSFLVGLPPGALDDDEHDEGIGPDDAELRLDQLEWHALSVQEVSVRGGKIELAIDDERREIDEDRAVVIRVWRPHPRRWWTADSPVRANLPILRELSGLTQHVGATIDSRLAGAGLLVLPDSIEVVGSAAEEAEQPADGEEEQTDPFVSALIESMTTPIRDRDSAASVVPLTVKVPEEAVDKVQHISFSTPFDERTKELRDEALRRLALGLDAPPEVLTGVAQMNHWSAWQVQEETVQIHVEPVLALVADAITTEFLWPVLEEAGVPNPRDYVVWFSTEEIKQRPNRAGEAQAVYDRGALSDAALRREAGFDDDDAPAEPETDEAVSTALELIREAPSLVAQPGITELVRQLRDALGIAQPDGTQPDEAEEAPEQADSGRELPDTQGEPPSDEAPAASAAGNGYAALLKEGGEDALLRKGGP